CTSVFMNVHIDISQSLTDQFADQLKLIRVGSEFAVPTSVGKGGQLKFIDFPGQLELYHFGNTRFRHPIYMKAINPTASEWFLVHINLASVKQEKTFDGKQIEFQKYLPIGILLYGPNLAIETKIPAHTDSELASVRFSYSFMAKYFDKAEEILDINKNLVYEDLSPDLESKILLALETMEDKLTCHALVLDFLKCFFEKLSGHDKGEKTDRLHPEDVKKLFYVSTYLRNPTSKQAMSIKELAAMANMGTTKFKTSFKQIFGKPPREYRNKIRMEYARKEMLVNHKSPSEISYLLGYTHPSNFTAAYKKYFGEVPSAI
ncbi:MAG: helix-turn-helix transcriptional regulator, partial [Saprospiraceae bacterium]|nr:helix-turn-helix transcriptional regulator [Saprospiraceae bacterium]